MTDEQEKSETSAVEQRPAHYPKRLHPTRLYHYCSASSMEAILRTKTIRLGRLSAMNDYREFTWTRMLASKRIDARLKAGASEKATQFLTTLRAVLREPVHADPYCACFSTNGDVLSQWRAYADNGRGFAIGFDPQSLRFSPSQNPMQVVYEQRFHEELVDSLLDFAEERQEFFVSPEAIEGIANTFHELLVCVAVILKNPKFRQEREFRVVHDCFKAPAPFDEIMAKSAIRRVRIVNESRFANEYVVDGADVRHFLSLPFDPAFSERSVVRLVLGPRNPAKSDKSVLRRMLASYGFEHVEIKQSRATLR